MVNQHGAEPGESEYSHGRGILPTPDRGYEPSPIDELRLSRQTETTNPDADWMELMKANPSTGLWKNGIWTPGHMAEDSTPMVRETGPSSTSGQHKRIDPGVYNEGHFADGLQDGSGEEWRKNFPPNKVL